MNEKVIVEIVDKTAFLITMVGAGWLILKLADKVRGVA